MSKNWRYISKVVREVGENLALLVGSENTRFLLSVYGDPNRARNALKAQDRQAMKIFEDYYMLGD